MDGELGQMITAYKCMVINFVLPAGDGDLGQRFTVFKSPESYCGHTFGDGDLGQRFTVFKSTAIYCGHTIGDDYSLDAAFLKRILTDLRYPVRDLYIFV